MSTKEAAAAKGMEARSQRVDDIVTILLALCMESHPSYLREFTTLAGVLADKEASKSTMQGWLKPYLDRAKDLATKAREQNGGAEAVSTPVKTPGKPKATAAKAKETSAKRKAAAAADEVEDEPVTPTVKSVKGRKATPKAKKVKKEEVVEEEDCDIAEEHGSEEAEDGDVKEEVKEEEKD